MAETESFTGSAQRVKHSGKNKKKRHFWKLFSIKHLRAHDQIRVQWLFSWAGVLQAVAHHTSADSCYQHSCIQAWSLHHHLITKTRPSWKSFCHCHAKGLSPLGHCWWKVSPSESGQCLQSLVREQRCSLNQKKEVCECRTSCKVFKSNRWDTSSKNKKKTTFYSVFMLKFSILVSSWRHSIHLSGSTLPPSDRCR